MKKFIALLLSVVCLFSLCATPVFAEETEGTSTIDHSDRANLSMTIDGEVCWCVERNARMPDEGYVYEDTEFECPERLIKVAVAIEELDDGEIKFHTAGQYAVWQCYERTNMVMYSTAIEGEEVGNYVKQILDYADTVNLEDYEVEVNFYGYVSGDTEQSEYGYQSVATFKVSKKGQEPETPVEPEPTGKTEIPEIIIDGEKYFCVEKDKLAPNDDDVYVIDEDYVISDRLRQLAVVISEKEYSHDAVVCAVWNIVSENDITTELKGMLDEAGLTDFDEIMALVDDVDIEKYDIEVTVYKPSDDCKQKLAQFSATLKTTSVSVSKEWNGEDANRPTSVEVQLYNDGVAYGDAVVLNADNEWTYTWNDLAIDGVWSVDEVNVPENYTKSIAQNGNTFVITNTYVAPVIPTIDITVNKVWDDENNANRPASVEIQLYKDGVAFGDKVVLNAENNWSYTFEDLEDGFAWTADEVSVPDNYEKAVSKEGNVITITNTYKAPVEPEDPENPDVPEDPDKPTEPSEPEKPETPTEPEKPTEPEPEKPKDEVSGDKVEPENPQTGDDFNLALWVSLTAISFAGIVILSLTKKKYLN